MKSIFFSKLVNYLHMGPLMQTAAPFCIAKHGSNRLK
jgi:hypothetical protein